MEESKGLPCQVPTTNVSKWFKFRVNVDQGRFHGLYRCLCKDYVEGRFACLATDIIPLPYLFIDARTSVSDIQTFNQLLLMQPTTNAKWSLNRRDNNFLTTLEDADSTQFYWWLDKSGGKGSKFGLQDVSVFNTIVSR